MDCSTKILLGLIASGLWAIALMPLLAQAQTKTEPAAYYLQHIEEGMRLIVNGQCANKKIC